MTRLREILDSFVDLAVARDAEEEGRAEAESLTPDVEMFWCGRTFTTLPAQSKKKLRGLLHHEGRRHCTDHLQISEWVSRSYLQIRDRMLQEIAEAYGMPIETLDQNGVVGQIVHHYAATAAVDIARLQDLIDGH